MSDYMFRPAKREDLPRLRGLWRTGFGDSDAFIACFEQRMASHPEWMELALCGDEPVAMLTMIPCALHIQGHGVFQSGFYYALTTDPAHRGRGIAPRLMANAAERRIGRGMDCLLGVPDTGSLFTYYHRVDHHRTAFYTRILLTTRETFDGCPGIPPERVDAEEYRAIREEYLAGEPISAGIPRRWISSGRSAGRAEEICTGSRGSGQAAPLPSIRRTGRFCSMSCWRRRRSWRPASADCWSRCRQSAWRCACPFGWVRLWGRAPPVRRYHAGWTGGADHGNGGVCGPGSGLSGRKRKDTDVPAAPPGAAGSRSGGLFSLDPATWKNNGGQQSLFSPQRDCWGIPWTFPSACAIIKNTAQQREGGVSCIASPCARTSR